MTILDADSATVEFTSAAQSVGEDSAALSVGVRLVTATGNTLENAATFNVTVASLGSAEAADFDSASFPKLITFAIGAGNNATQTVAFTQASDTLIEGDETLTLGLTKISGASTLAVTTTGNATDAVTILDADSATVEFTTNAQSVGEDAAALSVGVRLVTAVGNTLENAATFNVTVASLGNAEAADFDSASFPKLITFAIGAGNNATQTVALAQASDTLIEGDETLTLGLAKVSGASTIAVTTTGNATDAVTILDADSATVEFTSAAQSVGEDAAALSVGVRLVTAVGNTLENAATFNVTVASLGNAEAADFDSASFPKLITFAAGAGNNATQTVALAQASDTLIEGDETLTLGLAKISGDSTIGVTGSGNVTQAVTILDADSATVEFTLAAQSIREDSATPLNVVAHLVTAAGNTLENAATFDVSVASLGTTTASDFDAASFPKTITFAGGSGNNATQTVTLDPTADSLVEGNETLTLGLAKTSGGSTITVSGNATQAVTILDDDVDLKITKTESVPTVVAGSGTGNLTYVVTLKTTGSSTRPASS